MLQLNRRAVTIAALWQTSKEHSDKNIRIVRVNKIKKKGALIYDTLPEKKRVLLRIVKQFAPRFCRIKYNALKWQLNWKLCSLKTLR